MAYSFTVLLTLSITTQPNMRMKNLFLTCLCIVSYCTASNAQVPATISYRRAALNEGLNNIYNNPRNGKTLVAVVEKGVISSFYVMWGSRILATLEPVSQSTDPPQPEPAPKPKPVPPPPPVPPGTKIEGTQKENIIKDPPAYKDTLSGATIDVQCDTLENCTLSGIAALQVLE